ncbi:ERAD-associated E3 ubiquitin-protein ligase HRD1A [Raphanus sativus]|uniref:RING-type E3 ubiquitin transferase n=1 Tax=Raphanus sativus TaxID=3726 RepID=A0A6J0JF22_RAPSA|nr:ERAD-associated E3 ubiquitin-protein ligase HRD1A-like isoform X1 [Raphanus sativus]KAJ4886609.1 ERAD-associated E3 ubiquitin-protein ligase HRD1A [Raphanus sativus]
MIRLRTYACLSFIATLSIIHHAFSIRGQFYPAAVYLSTSKISLMLLLNMCLVLMLALWHLVKLLFLGSLREAEIERLNEQAWRELMEILFAITIFRQDFSSGFLPLVVTLLLIKALHWLAQKRVEFIETAPNVTKLAHVRIVSFLAFLLVVDSIFMYSSVRHLVRSRQASVSLFFSFEYMILATTTVAIFVKYVFFVTDMIMDGQWEKKPVYTFYLELIRDLLHLSMYICFFFVIFMNYGVPLHLLRELYETFRNFQIRVSDYLRYRKITSNMNDRFPDATPEELTASDATCIICREEMTTAKKLICGHLFHVHCLRSWLERQQTCPTCRALVVPPENGTSTTAAGQRGLHQGSQQGTSSSGGQGSETRSSAGGSNDSLSRHHARLQAAASAASMYGKSMVYPSADKVAWSPGFPGTEKASAEPHGTHPSSSSAASQLPQQNLPGENSRAYANIPADKLETMKKSLESQLETLRNRLQFLESTGEADDKGKRVVDRCDRAAE